jgi:hypothetical protein
MAILDVKKTGATYSTLAAAYAAASDNDIIEIQDSEVYNEQLTIAKENLTIRNAVGVTPSIISYNFVITVQNTVTNFTIHGQTNNKLKLKTTVGATNVIVFSAGTNITTHDLEFYELSNQKCYYSTNSTGTIQIKDCVFNRGYALGGSFTGIQMEGCSGTLKSLAAYNNLAGYIRQNNITITDTILDPLSGGSVFGDLIVSANFFKCSAEGNVYMIQTIVAGLKFENNTVISTLASTLANFANTYNVTATDVFTNNIIVGFNVGINSSKIGARGDYNLIACDTNYSGLLSAGAHDIQDEDPLLINDYKLDALSPCKGTGTSTVSYTYDIDGTLRTEPYDIGCWQHLIYGLSHAWQDTVQSAILKFDTDIDLSYFENAQSCLNPVNYTLGGTLYDYDILKVEAISSSSVKLYFSNRVVDQEEYTIIVSGSVRNSLGEIMIPLTCTCQGTYVSQNKSIEKLFNQDLAGNYYDETAEDYTDILKINTTGDIQLLSAKESLKRLIEEICVTNMGNLVYAQFFGTDFQIKTLITPSTLLRIKRTCENSIRNINNVKDVSVSVINNLDKVTVNIQVETDLGIIKTSFNGVQL